MVAQGKHEHSREIYTSPGWHVGSLSWGTSSRMSLRCLDTSHS